MADIAKASEAGSRLGWNPVDHYKDVEVAERYDRERFSSIAGRVFNALEQASLRRILRHIPRSAHFIDIPCGTGRMAEVLLEMNYRVTGADISPAMLEVANRKLSRFGGRFDTIVCDARELSKAGGRYDAALCARVLMHFPLSGQIEFLNGIAEAVPGPIIISQSLDSTYHRFRRKLKHLLGHQSSAGYPITEAELAELLRRCNLREVRRARAMAPISESMVVLTNRA
jgi:2-polyprenyl-3-methyl-5-hydroxy-6-metoxy-1,4-benzoquinol methylase